MKDFNKYIEAFKNMEAKGFMTELIKFVIWIAFIFLLVWLVNKAINRSVTDTVTRYRVKKVTRLISYGLIGLLAIITFTGKAQYFGVALGLITAGIAFALQEVILSFAGWVTIFTTNSYKPGDRIEINDVKGDVIDIGLTKTTLMEIGVWIHGDNYSGRIVQVSNANVIRGVVRNYSTDFPFVWDEILIPIKYGSDLEATREIIQTISQELLQDYANYASQNWNVMVKKYLIENANVAPMISFQLTDNWIEFNLRYVVDYKKRRSTKHSIFRSLHDSINASEGKVQLASATFEITDLPEFKIQTIDNETKPKNN